jgi:hypothetical protein
MPRKSCTPAAVEVVRTVGGVLSVYKGGLEQAASSAAMIHHREDARMSGPSLARPWRTMRRYDAAAGWHARRAEDHPTAMIFPLELVARFEQHYADSVASLITHSLEVTGNPEGYALYRDGAIRATLSTNPRAGWATDTWGVGGQPVESVRRVVVEFFNRHGVPARMRVVPGGLTRELADALTSLGLRQVRFHTILWAPLPRPAEPVTEGADIREVSTVAELDAHIDIELSAYGVPQEIIDRLRPLRRTWLASPDRRFYLAYVDGRPAAEAILHWRGDLAYLEAAGTRPEYRRRGLQRALVRRRIADATKLGCRLIFGGADFEGVSRTNQMAGGLTVAYLAAIWEQRRDAMLPPPRPS